MQRYFHRSLNKAANVIRLRDPFARNRRCCTISSSARTFIITVGAGNLQQNKGRAIKTVRNREGGRSEARRRSRAVSKGKFRENRAACNPTPGGGSIASGCSTIQIMKVCSPEFTDRRKKEKKKREKEKKKESRYCLLDERPRIHFSTAPLLFVRVIRSYTANRVYVRARVRIRRTLTCVRASATYESGLRLCRSCTDANRSYRL